MVESASEIRMDWRSRHAEAARDARHLCKFESPVQVIIALMVTLATLFFIWNVGGQNDAATELTTRIGTSLGILLIFPFVYLWKLFRVGWWIERRASMLMIFFGALVAIGGAGIAGFKKGDSFLRDHSFLQISMEFRSMILEKIGPLLHFPTRIMGVLFQSR